MNSPPGLKEQFTRPEGWRWGEFKRAGRSLRYGCVFPADIPPKAVIVCLPGLSEYGEKYYETARWALANDLAFWVIDWFGQGLSGRYPDCPEHRFSHGFEEDIADIGALIQDYIVPSSVHTDVGRIPMAMLAHSTGANIGLRHIHLYPGQFHCAAFSAPLLGIKALELLPRPVDTGVCFMLAKIWAAIPLPKKEKLVLTHDPERARLDSIWLNHNPQLSMGNITCTWLYEALKSCRFVTQKSILESIDIPCLLASVRDDPLVSESQIRRAQRYMPHSELIEFSGSGHEILMERDEIRLSFLSRFYKLIKSKIIDNPEGLRLF